MNLKEHFTKPRKVALYMYVSGVLEGTVHISEVHYRSYDERYNPLPEGQLREQIDSDCTRISEPVEISFTAADSDQIIANAVASLDEAERRLRDELNQKIADLRGRKAQLLALTHQAEPIDG